MVSRSTCPICQEEAVKEKKKNDVDVLKCSSCSHLVHFTCTNLPPYMLYSLSTSTKKYTCEVCTTTPESFLTGIVTNICNVSKRETTTPAFNAEPIVDKRYDILENKINDLSVVLEKFDLHNMADNLSQLGNKLELTTNNMTANIKAINQLKKNRTEPKATDTCLADDDPLQEELSKLRKDLELVQKELASSRSSNELLMSTITERDAALATIRERLEKNSHKHVEKDKRIMALQSENKQLKEANATISNEKSAVSEQWSVKAQTSNRERDQLAQELDILEKRFNDVKSKHDSSLEVNCLLKDQLKSANQLNNSLKDSITQISLQRNTRPPRNQTSGEDDTDDEDEEEDGRDEVVIFHDSLCGKINDTLLSREKLKVKKVWAPDMARMEEALDHVDAKVIVLEAWTRDLDRLEVEEMNQRIIDLVSKAATKAEKVVISTIVNREDVEDIDLKVNSVNAFINLKYKRNESVIVCDNYKLYNSNFRKDDKLHLNDDGVPVLASNLKYAIAEAAGVQVIKKNRHFEQQHEQEGRRFGRNRDYRGSRW